MKNSRQEAICDIIRTHPVGTQKMLAELLRGRGFPVTQTTVSRDIKELQLVKVPTDDGGYKYMLPGASPDTERNTEVFRHAVREAFASSQLVILKTDAGAALLTAQAVDAFGFGHCLGTVAGYDTVFIAADSEESARRMCEEISGYVDRDKNAR